LSSPDPFLAAAGRVGGLTCHANHDSKAIAARARAGLDARFEREVAEYAAAHGETLTPADIAARAEYARRAYFAKMTLERMAARRAKAASR
jgi:hypothetical protein